MKLYYTTLGDYNTNQTIPDLSLGNYKSSSIIPNDLTGSIFSNLNIETLKRGRDTAIAVIIDVETSENENLTITYTSSLFDLYFAIQKPVKKNINASVEVYSLDKLSSSQEKPYLDLEKIEDSNTISILENKEGIYIGLWLVRKLKESKTLYEIASDETLVNSKDELTIDLN